MPCRGLLLFKKRVGEILVLRVGIKLLFDCILYGPGLNEMMVDAKSID